MKRIKEIIKHRPIKTLDDLCFSAKMFVLLMCICMPIVSLLG